MYTMTINKSKIKPEYLENPQLHLAHLYRFKERTENKILGERNMEWRAELEFVLSQTIKAIREVQASVL